MLTATYVHNWDPVIIQITEKIALRWYGLAYVGGFLLGFLILRQLARKKLWVVEEDKVADVVTYTAFFGVFLGGRLGYVFFYLIPREGWQVLLDDPLLIVRVWEGGMASHGGILGIMLFTLFYAWKNKISWPGLGDGLCVVAPLGILFGRIANFINGELYGHVTNAWYGIKFPKALLQNGNLSDALDAAGKHNEEIATLAKTSLDHPSYALDRSLEIARDNPDVLAALGDHVQPRHASQLYEGILEGAVLFTILYAIRLLYPKLRHGILTGLFFILYATFRILVENVRVPDSDSFFIGTALEMTRGQFLSSFMILIGLAFLTYALKKAPTGQNNSA